MVFFNTYRNKRLIAPNALMNPLVKVGGWFYNYAGRAWQGSVGYTLPGEMRLWAAVIPLIYFFHRWHNDHALEVDAYEKALILRWGGSLEEARKLSPQDQIRVRNFVDTEKLYSSYGPKEAIIQPAGDTLPGKDYYHKQGQSAHH